MDANPLSPIVPLHEWSYHETRNLIYAIKNTKSSSSPFHQIPYIILKKCPSMQVSPHFPLQWKTAAVKLIGKLSATEDPCSSSNFQLIALTPTIRKIFTTIMKQRLLDYIMINNNFMDKYIQKAFVPAISCCIEHHSKLAAVRFSVRKFHHSLAIAWQDIANAYGHSLIQFALSCYCVPLEFSQMV